MRDAAEGNSGQGDSLLSLEAEEEELAYSDTEGAEGPTARKRMRRDEEQKKLEQQEEHADS